MVHFVTNWKDVPYTLKVWNFCRFWHVIKKPTWPDSITAFFLFYLKKELFPTFTRHSLRYYADPYFVYRQRHYVNNWTVKFAYRPLPRRLSTVEPRIVFPSDPAPSSTYSPGVIRECWPNPFQAESPGCSVQRYRGQWYNICRSVRHLNS